MEVQKESTSRCDDTRCLEHDANSQALRGHFVSIHIGSKGVTSGHDGLMSAPCHRDVCVRSIPPHNQPAIVWPIIII